MENSNQLIYCIRKGMPVAVGQPQFANWFTTKDSAQIITKDEFKRMTSEYKVLYRQDQYMVERFNRPAPIGVEYKVTDNKRMVSFNTSVCPMVQFNQSQHIDNLITDYIDMCMDDYSQDDFTDFTETEA